MFKNILLATTGAPACDHAANVAFDLAEKYDARLNVFHTFGIPTRGFSQSATDVRTGEEAETVPAYTEWVTEELKNTYAKQLEKAKEVRIDSVAGVPHTEILRKARREDMDLIVMGAHTREEEAGATRHRTYAGNTLRKVTKKAHCPVLIISRPCTTCFWYFNNIVVGTDFSRASWSAFLFALKAAKAIGCKLYLFHALDLSSIPAIKIEGQEEIESQIAEAKKKMEDKYRSKMDKEGFDNYEMAVWEGVPYVEILKYAREKNGDLIVMAHHAREIDPDEAELGSTVEQVVLRASCPVASVNKPDKLDA